MQAKNLINTDIPHLEITDTGDVAIDLMETYKITHLPIIDEKKNLVGIISEDEIYDFELFDVRFKDCKRVFQHYFADENEGFFSVINKFKLYNTTIIPVLSAKNKTYLGLVSPMSVLRFLFNLQTFDRHSYTLFIKVPREDFSVVPLANIIETNQGKLLFLLTDFSEKKSEVKILLLVKSENIEEIMHSFEHFDYNAKILDISPEKYEDFYKERLDNLLNFINI